MTTGFAVTDKRVFSTLQELQQADSGNRQMVNCFVTILTLEEQYNAAGIWNKAK